MRAARRTRRACGGLVLVTLAALVPGCASIGRMKPIAATVAPMQTSSERGHGVSEGQTAQLHALFGDTLIGFQPGTADSMRRFLGRLRGGYTADTLNVILCGDNRPGMRSVRLAPELQIMRQGLSLNPLKIARGLLYIPVTLFKGLVPDLALVRDIPAMAMHMPKWGREHQVMNAMLAKVDSLHARGQDVAVVVNTGDLVEDGRRPAHWQRFLRITQPLASRVPYFGVPGNHERTDTPEGIQNWRTATGLPGSSDRLYYCFDTADGWLRFIGLDSNPIVDPGSHWTREVQVKYSQEEFTWLVERVKEHVGPVVVMMHHPPFSSGAHRDEWQRDAMLRERRTRMVEALHEAGISIIASGHEHSYQRALLTWPDAVLIAVVSGGAGAPLHDIPPPAEAARLFSQYQVAGSVVKPQNVFTAQTFNFSVLRLWFGGGELYTYSVDDRSRATEIDRVQIDLKRYGVPKIDQHKIVVPPTHGPKEPMHAEKTPMIASPKTDSTAASQRLLSQPRPGRGAKSAPAAGDSLEKRPR